MTHPDIERIAEHLEGLLDARESSRIADHLSACTECARSADELTEVRSLLAAHARPVPMPPDVVNRVDATLAAESQAREQGTPTAAAGDTAAAEQAGTTDEAAIADESRTAQGVPSLADRRRRRRRLVASGLVAAAAVTVVGIGVSQVLQDTQDGATSSAESGAGGSAQRDARSRGPAATSGKAPAQPREAPGAQHYGQQDGSSASSGQRALIESVASRHARDGGGRERAACVEGALGEGWRGASYAVGLNGQPGVVVLRPRSEPTVGTLIRCAGDPTVVRQLSLNE